MTAFDLLGVVSYGAVTAVALGAAVSAGQVPPSIPPRPASEARWWVATALFFIGLAALRIANAEDRGREAMRQAFVRYADYHDRWSFQKPLLVVAVLIGLGMMWLAWDVWRRKRRSRLGRFVAMAQVAMIGFVPLFGLRMLSLHAADRLLYAKPVKPNWLIDGGLTLLAGLAAFAYIRHIVLARQGRLPQGPPHR